MSRHEERPGTQGASALSIDRYVGGLFQRLRFDVAGQPVVSLLRGRELNHASVRWDLVLLRTPEIVERLIGDFADDVPQRDVDRYVEEAVALGVTIRHVFLTHFHADFLAGHLELRERTGAEIYVGRQGEPEYPASLMRDGESLRMGPVRLVFLETPGHTPESVSIVVFDEEADSEKPHAVLTGDTLFIGDVGRPDLLAGAGLAPEDMILGRPGVIAPVPIPHAVRVREAGDRAGDAAELGAVREPALDALDPASNPIRLRISAATNNKAVDERALVEAYAVVGGMKATVIAHTAR